MPEMTDRTPVTPVTPPESETEAQTLTLPQTLPTRQKNALRLLLAKPVISAEEVARIDYRVLERAPGVGKKSIDIIQAWLHSQGYQLNGLPQVNTNPRLVQRKRKLERAIDYLRWHGYEVHRSGQ